MGVFLCRALNRNIKLKFLDLQEYSCDVHVGWGGEQNTLYKEVETFPQQTRFKALRGSPKRKAQRGQYLLAVDLGRYKWYQNQTPDDVLAFSLFPEGE